MSSDLDSLDAGGGGAIADDLLDGGLAYAEYLGLPLRRVYDLLERGLLPGGKLGHKWIGSKARVRRHYLELSD